MTRLLIPETGATLSAAGALLSDLTAEHAAACFASTRAPDWRHLDRCVEDLRRRCQAFIAGPGQGAVESVVSVTAEARYQNQVWEIDVPFDFAGPMIPDDIQRFRASFDRQHKALFTVEDPRSEVEIVGMRATVRCRLTSRKRFRLPSSALSAERGRREVFFPGVGAIDTPVRALDSLPEGQEFKGPAILESRLTTVVVDPAARYVRQPTGSLVVYP